VLSALAALEAPTRLELAERRSHIRAARDVQDVVAKRQQPILRPLLGLVELGGHD
jgi:hypothetical protein